jgi:uncharacterized protein (TIGR02147 family)
MRSIFEYLDYRDLLKDAFEERKAKSPLYGYRMMAEALGQDTSNIFRILQKDAHLPARCQSRAIEYLGLTNRSAEYFVLLIAYARERSPEARHEILEKALALRDVECRQLADKEVEFFRDWWIAPIRALLEVVGGKAQASALAKRLKPEVSETEVEKALTLLLELGLVKKASSGRLVLSEAHLNANGKEKAEAVRSYQRQVLALASESIERFPKEQRDVSTLTLAVDEAAFKELREMMREFRQQVQKRVEETPHPDRVMQLSMAFFPLAPAQEETR